MTLIVLVGIALAAWWFVAQVRKAPRAIQRNAVRPPDWVPPKECPLCNQPMDDSEEGVLFCLQKDCPLFMEIVYLRDGGAWNPCASALPIFEASMAYRKAMREGSTEVVATAAAEAAYQQSYAKHVAPQMTPENQKIQEMLGAFKKWTKIMVNPGAEGLEEAHAEAMRKYEELTQNPTRD